MCDSRGVGLDIWVLFGDEFVIYVVLEIWFWRFCAIWSAKMYFNPGWDWAFVPFHIQKWLVLAIHTRLWWFLYPELPSRASKAFKNEYKKKCWSFYSWGTRKKTSKGEEKNFLLCPHIQIDSYKIFFVWQQSARVKSNPLQRMILDWKIGLKTVRKLSNYK